MFGSQKLTIPVRSPIDADVLEGDEVAVEEPFNPVFTYPIFGEQEKIFGYQGLNIQVSPVPLSGEWSLCKETNVPYSSITLLAVYDNSSTSRTMSSSNRKLPQPRISRIKCINSSLPTIQNQQARLKKL